MHFMSQPRYNPRTQRDDWYYRIKESFRDLTGRVRSRVMLNVGFIDEPHRPEDIRDIGKCLTYIHEQQGEKDLFGNPMSRYNGFVQRKTQEFWHEMVNNGSIDAVKATMEESRKKAITTEATNVLGEKVHMRLCSEPNKSADDIYERLKYKKMPFRKIKIEKSL